ncbi:ATP-binding cassette sub-family A member 3 [Nephila pilipes]|uniref:ATP-binding cassette sub-family A member 3 n=1 Tax=Nephila pilipes TaxID=299642 RepID=A0A8X6T9A4_NEPPI|nr:ATP-binding cassette sub-family A member 3 [Nephila pilipes]
MFENAPALRQFVILLYKGLLLRKRHYIVTFCEIVLPIVIASIPVIMMSEMSRPEEDIFKPGKRSWIEYKTYEPFDPYDSSSSRYGKIQFLFVPNTPFAYQFMTEAVEMFRVNSRHDGNTTIKGTGSEKEMESYSLYQQRDNTDTVIIGTIFKDFVNDLPTSLDYKIRHSPTSYGSFFQTQLKYRVNGPTWSNGNYL